MNSDFVVVLATLGSFAALGFLMWVCDALMERKS